MTGMATTRTKIGIYKDGTWYLDYNGNGACGIQALTNWIISERLAGHRLSGNGVEKTIIITIFRDCELQSFLIFSYSLPLNFFYELDSYP